MFFGVFFSSFFKVLFLGVFLRCFLFGFSSLGVFFEHFQNLCFTMGVFLRYLKIGVLFGCFFPNIVLKFTSRCLFHNFKVFFEMYFEVFFIFFEVLFVGCFSGVYSQKKNPECHWICSHPAKGQSSK